MPELRTDWLIGRSVFIAESRALRPNEFASPTAGEPPSAGGGPVTTCPFCAGNEALTPPAVYEKCDAAGRWLVRVVPNAYPAVNYLSGVEGVENRAHNLTAAEAASPAAGLQLALGITGAHEVIIESPVHVDRMAAISLEQLRSCCGVRRASAALAERTSASIRPGVQESRTASRRVARARTQPAHRTAIRSAGRGGGNWRAQCSVGSRPGNALTAISSSKNGLPASASSSMPMAFSPFARSPVGSRTKSG